MKKLKYMSSYTRVPSLVVYTSQCSLRKSFINMLRGHFKTQPAVDRPEPPIPGGCHFRSFEVIPKYHDLNGKMSAIL